MPKIDAPTVAEQRTMRRQALLEAALEMLRENADADLNFAELAERTGLARTTVYEYFESKDDLVGALCEHVFPRWVRRVRAAVAEARTAEEGVAAFVRAQLEPVARGEHRLAQRQGKAQLDPRVSRRIRRLHTEMLAPLLDALADLGREHSKLEAALIQGIVNAAVLRIDAGDPPQRVMEVAVSLALDGLTR